MNTFRSGASVVILLCSLGGGCTTVGPAFIPAKPAVTSLKFFPQDQAEEYILGVSKAGVRNTTGSLLQERSESLVVNGEPQVAAACRGEAEKKESGLVALVLPYVIEKGVSYIVDRADQALQDELKKYTASFEGTDQQSLYVSTQANGPVLANQCFRLSRQVTSNGVERTAMDFVGRIEIRGPTLVLTPLRLYYASTLAETDSSNTTGVAISLKMSDIWREANRGKSEDAVVSTTLVSEKVVLDEKHPFYYQLYNIAQTSPNAVPPKTVTNKTESRAPLPPWSTWDQRLYEENWITTNISVAEVGNPPWLLKNAANIFHANKDSITKNLEAAADKAVGVTASGSPVSSAAK